MKASLRTSRRSNSSEAMYHLPIDSVGQNQSQPLTPNATLSLCSSSSYSSSSTKFTYRIGFSSLTVPVSAYSSSSRRG